MVTVSVSSVLYRASDRMSLTLRHAAGSDSSGGRWTLAAQVTPLERWTTEIEVGVDTEASGEESLPNAARIASTLSLGPSTTRVDFRQNEKGYLGSGAERFVAVSQDLQITDNHRLTLRWNSYRGFADGLGSNAPGTEETRRRSKFKLAKRLLEHQLQPD